MKFPKSTELNKRIPKQKFYEKLPMTPALKEEFKEIKSIYWKNKLSPDTINLEPGELVKEIQVFELNLTKPKVSQLILKQIDKQIPYHILFLLEFNKKYQAWIAYKEISQKSQVYNPYQYFHTDWFPINKLPIDLGGINLDRVYENFINQIAGEELEIAEKTDSKNLKEIISNQKNIQRIEKQINTLQKKMKNEKQLNKQIEINELIKRLKRELTLLREIDEE